MLITGDGEMGGRGEREKGGQGDTDGLFYGMVRKSLSCEKLCHPSAARRTGFLFGIFVFRNPECWVETRIPNRNDNLSCWIETF